MKYRLPYKETTAHFDLTTQHPCFHGNNFQKETIVEREWQDNRGQWSRWSITKKRGDILRTPPNVSLSSRQLHGHEWSYGEIVNGKADNTFFCVDKKPCYFPFLIAGLPRRKRQGYLRNNGKIIPTIKEENAVIRWNNVGIIFCLSIGQKGATNMCFYLS